MIFKYSFGKININSKTYEKDLVLFENNVDDSWWREEGHLLTVNDIKKYIDMYKPDLIIVGTGNDGMLKIDDSTISYLEENSINLLYDKTEHACQLYNTLSKLNRVVGFFHLTC